MPFTFGVTSLFSPNDPVADEILAKVGSAQKSIRILAYGFTLKPLMDVLIAKHKAGIIVQLVLDRTQAAGVTEEVQVSNLIQEGLDVVIGTSPKAGQIMHEKGICIDEEITITGSYNFSVSAASQVNHIDVFYSTDRAKWFTDFFQEIRAWVVQNEPQYQPKPVV